jgi:hypothetical protein
MKRLLLTFAGLAIALSLTGGALATNHSTTAGVKVGVASSSAAFLVHAREAAVSRRGNKTWGGGSC